MYNVFCTNYGNRRKYNKGWREASFTEAKM